MSPRWNEVVDAVVGGADPRLRRLFALDRLSDAGFDAEVAALERALAGMAARGGEAAPIPGVLDRIEAALDAEARVEAYAANLRAAELEWEPRSPGVVRKRLWDDRTWLARIEPGHAFPPHDHDVVEHCLVLAGTMVVDGVRFGPGDYHAPRPGTRHEAFTTPDGLLLMIRYGD